MADSTSSGPGSTGSGLSATTKAALGKLPAAEAVSVLDEFVARAAGNNNNNSDGGAAMRAASTPLTRDQLLQKMSTAMSDDQLQAILKSHGVI